MCPTLCEYIERQHRASRGSHIDVPCDIHRSRVQELITLQWKHPPHTDRIYTYDALVRPYRATHEWKLSCDLIDINITDFA